MIHNWKKKILYYLENINYLVAFKRLKGTFDVYNKMVSLFLKNKNVREIVDFEQMGVDMSSSSNQDDDDEKAGDDQ